MGSRFWASISGRQIGEEEISKVSSKKRRVVGINKTQGQDAVLKSRSRRKKTLREISRNPIVTITDPAGGALSTAEPGNRRPHVHPAMLYLGNPVGSTLLSGTLLFCIH